MSRKGLAYLFLAAEPVERFKGSNRGGEGLLGMEDIARALADFVRHHQAWASPIVLVLAFIYIRQVRAEVEEATAAPGKKRGAK